MSRKKDKSNSEDRTRKIPVYGFSTPSEENQKGDEMSQPEQKSGDQPLLKALKPVQNNSFELNIVAAHSPNQANKKSTAKKVPVSPSETEAKNHKKITAKIWNTLEWLAASALLFMAIFFAINFSSYSQLFKLKLDELRGEAEENPFVQEMLQPPAQKTEQKLLPVAQTPEQSKKQIPALALQVSPPDDRVIIPSINQNVPIVSVSTENLINRDWNALEKEIQGALQDGVVHYPGTAQPGDHGNVVITGHSSYFPWDPGRFKDVFAALHKVAVGETVIVYHEQKQYLYKVYEIKEVTPDKVEVLAQEGGDRLTLITCTPVGTNLRRLIVLARPVT